LANHGVTPDTMRDLNEAKSAFHYTAPRIKASKEQSIAEQNAYNEMMAKNPGMIAKRKPRAANEIYDADLTPQDTSQMADATALTKRLEDMISPIRGVITPEGIGRLASLTPLELSKKLSDLVGAGLAQDLTATYQRMIKRGWNPWGNNAHQELMNEFFNTAKNQVIGISGVGSLDGSIDGWGDEEQRAKLDQYLNTAKNAMIGQNDLQMVPGQNVFPEMVRYYQAGMRAGSGNNQLRGIPAAAVPRRITTDLKTSTNIYTNPTRSEKDIIDYQDGKKMMPDKKEAIGIAETIFNDTKDMNESQLLNYLESVEARDKYGIGGIEMVGGTTAVKKIHFQPDDMFDFVIGMRNVEKTRNAELYLSEKYNLPPEQIRQLSQDYVTKTNTMLQMGYYPTSESARKGMENESEAVKRNMESSGGWFTVNNGKELNIKDKFRSNAGNNKQKIEDNMIFQNYVPNASNRGQGIMSFKSTVNGKTYNFEIPSITISNAFENTGIIQNAIIGMYSMDPKQVYLPIYGGYITEIYADYNPVDG